MAQNDVLKRYLDAGIAFTTLTQARAEALVKDLVKAGEVQADQARDTVTDLLERSRKNSEKLLDSVRKEVRNQITSLGLASKSDLDRLEARIASLFGAAPAAKKAAARPAAKTATAKRATAKKAPAKKKAATKRTAAKKTATKKAGARKATATKRT
ncbi:MAG: phasin family protein [Acidimicrobiales bacterium]